MRITSSLTVLLLGAAAACTPDRAPQAPSVVLAPGDSVPVRRLRSEPYPLTFYSGMRSAQRLVLRDEESWRAAWATIWAQASPAPALPAVDFAHEMVVVAALGEHSSGGYSIVIESATATSAGVVVAVHSSSPGNSCFTTSAVTQPVDVAMLPRSDAPVRFAESSNVAACR